MRGVLQEDPTYRHPARMTGLVRPFIFTRNPDYPEITLSGVAIHLGLAMFIVSVAFREILVSIHNKPCLGGFRASGGFGCF